MSTSKKFIIGLGTTVPSTRVLQPPGGVSSDLFGLKTRQNAILKSMEEIMGKMSQLQVRELIDKSKSQNSSFKVSKKSESSQIIDTSKGADIKPPGYVAKDFLNLVPFDPPANDDGHILKPSKGHENLLLQYASVENEEVKSTTENTLDNEPKQIESLPALNRQNYRRTSSLENEFKGLVKAQSLFSDRIRNPITGAITKGDKDERCSLVKDIDSNNRCIDYSYGKRPAGVKVEKSTIDVDLGHSKRRGQLYVRRNPITGEGTKDDSSHYKHFQHCMRVI